MNMRIIADSTCDLTFEAAKALEISLLPLKVHFGQETYVDKLDLSSELFFEKLASSSAMPTTSMLTPQDFITEFGRYPDEEILVVCLSSHLSGTCHSAEAAKKESGRDDIFIVDSGTASIGAALMVWTAVRLRDEGQSAAQAHKALMDLRPRLRLYAMIDTLKYLVKGGRLSGVSGALGTILSLKPIITVRDGQVLSLDKARGVRGAIRKMTELVKKEPMDKTLPIGYAHAGDREMLGQLSHALGVEAPDVYLGSVVGAHAGPGALVVAYFIAE
jgi:DegV family protein with EDD domain